MSGVGEAHTGLIYTAALLRFSIMVSSGEFAIPTNTNLKGIG
jgi:hypothetical protein